MKKTFLFSLFCLAGSALAEVPKVVATIKPIYALAEQVMAGVGKPTLLIESASPHGYQMTTQDAKTLATADVLVWTGADMETFLPDVLPKLKADVRNLNWSEVRGVELLSTREGGAWGEHSHAEGEEHHHGAHDLHLWLSTYNASILLKELEKTLIELDPEHAEQYRANGKKARLDLIELNKSLKEQLKPYQTSAYLVFHDAYQYFEQDYDLHPLGSIRVTPEHEASPQRMMILKQMLADKNIICVFKEPQFPAKLVDKLVADTKVKVGILDPLGADLPAEVETYSKILKNLAHNLNECLK